MNESVSPNSMALLSALRDAEVNTAAAAGLKLRVHTRLSASLLGLSPALTSNAKGASNASHATALRPSGVMRAVTTKSIIIATLAPVFALGVLTGMAADRWPSHRSTAKVQPAVAASVAATASTSPFVALEPAVKLEDLVLLRESEPAVPSSVAAASASSAASLAAERSLLDEARHALARGEPRAGLAPLEQHAARFPKGILTEEREALTVRVLAALGNASAAASRAENFHRRFPNSLFTPAVDNAVASILRRNAPSETKP